MEQRKIVGIRRVDMKTKDGQDVRGYKFFVEYEDPNISGVGTDSFFLSDAKLTGSVPSIGDIVYLYYNRYGRVERVDIVG